MSISAIYYSTGALALKLMKAESHISICGFDQSFVVVYRYNTYLIDEKACYTDAFSKGVRDCDDETKTAFRTDF
jgi:hypothetical protein